MNGLLETPGLTVAGHLEHGLVKVAPIKLVFIFLVQDSGLRALLKKIKTLQTSGLNILIVFSNKKIKISKVKKVFIKENVSCI